MDAAHEVIAEAGVGLQCLLDKRRRLEEQIKFIADEEKELHRYIRAHEAILSQSALRRIPPEILEEIFEYGLHSGQPSALGRATWDTRLPPWNFTQVCRRWRSAGSSCPRLWRNLSINSGRGGVRMWSIAMSFPVCLARSGRQPISLEMKLQRADKHLRMTSSEPHHASVIQTILSDPSRYRRISIELAEASSWICNALNTHRGQFNNLEYLKLSSNALGGFRIGPMFNAFEVAPKLLELELDGRLAYTFSPPWTFPLSQLSRLTLAYIHCRDALVILRQAVNLVECTLENPDSNTAIGAHNTSEPAMAYLPSLQKLVLRGTWCSFHRRLFAPNIKTFEVSYDVHESSNSILNYTLTSAGQSITTFALFDIPGLSLSLPLFTQYLQRLPHLETLALDFNPRHITGNEVPDYGVFCALYTDASHILAPNLRSLKMINLPVQACTHLTDMLEKRAALQAPFQTLRVSFLPGPLPSSNRLRKEGAKNFFLFYHRLVRLQKAHGLDFKLSLNNEKFYRELQ